MEFHEAANIFPLDEENIVSLSQDIAANGQQIPIELFDGKILDGRRRWMACERAGVDPKFRDVCHPDPVAYVLSINLHRRHLTPSQRAMAGARARGIYDEQAKARQKVRKGDQPKATVENLPPLSEGKARDEVGKAVGVSGRSIDYATKVLENAEPEVIKAVDEGKMAVSTAAILSTESPEKQREEATTPKRNRTYNSVSNGGHEEKQDDDSDDDQQEKRGGVGVIRANEAINSLTRIPKNDALRKRGFQIVTDWIKHNN